MPRTPHSAAFIAVRDALLALEDDNRRRLTGLYGAMTEPLADPSPTFIAFLRAIAALDDRDHVRLARWVRTYVSRWGQVPSAASFRMTPAPREKPPEG